MSRRAHLWLRLSAVAVIAAAAAIPRTSAVAERPVGPAASVSADRAEAAGHRHVPVAEGVIGAGVLTASAMNVLPETDTVTVDVASPVSAELEAPLRKDAKPPVARR